MTWQSASVIYPDVEVEVVLGVRALLAARGETALVDLRFPKQRMPRMVIFSRDGGAAADFRDVAQVRCRVWAETFEGARTLARTVAALMQGMGNGSPILKVEQQSGPYEVPDESGEPQFYMLFDVHTRGALLS